MTVISATWDRYDEEFAGIGGDAYLECLFSGGRWLEGPVYHPAWRMLLFSDIPNDRMLRWNESDGSVSVFRQPCGYTNGHTLDRSGRLISCEQGGRRVSRTEHDGRVTTIAATWNGRRLNSPNDVVVTSDNAVWFTDPPYGIIGDYEGVAGEPEIDGCHVYRVDPHSGEVDIVADDFTRPNGIAFSGDEKSVFIVDTALNHIRRFAVDGRRLTGGEVIARAPGGKFDGLRLDTAGRLWVAADDVYCLTDSGRLLGRLRIPQPAVSNVVFGGAKRNRLFVCATSSVYSMSLNINGMWRL